MRLIICLLLFITLFSCSNNKKLPDVSNIKIQLATTRFEKDLFGIDTTHFEQGLQNLESKYPNFTENFIYTVLTSDPLWSKDSVASYVAAFVSSYRPVYDTAEQIFLNFTPYKEEIEQALRYLKYYFPAYNVPHQLITYVGPLDGFGDIIAEDAIIVGLHAHLGKNYSAYKSTWVQETYPDYLTRRFEPSFISINCMKNIVSDMFPDKNEEKTLVLQMVEKGKQLYMLSQILPEKEEYKLIGYSEQQLKDCYSHEAQIWDLFVQNNLLQTIDNNIIKNYLGEGPKTQELGDASPGNIGSFSGWQIVKKYMEKNPETKLPQLMTMDPETIFNDAKYKP